MRSGKDSLMDLDPPMNPPLVSVLQVCASVMTELDTAKCKAKLQDRNKVDGICSYITFHSLHKFETVSKTEHATRGTNGTILHTYTCTCRVGVRQTWLFRSHTCATITA